MRKLLFALCAVAVVTAPQYLHRFMALHVAASAESFNALRNGMTYEQARDIIGCEGVLMSSSEIAGFSTHMVVWDGKGSIGANMNVMFQNGRLMRKSQFGLR
jgi:hypothetical protein